VKKVYIISLFFVASCSSTLPFSTNPDKNAYNSGTIGSVKATDDIAPVEVNPPVVKTDSVRQLNHFAQ
jgi:hypothetical protein